MICCFIIHYYCCNNPYHALSLSSSFLQYITDNYGWPRSSSYFRTLQITTVVIMWCSLFYKVSLTLSISLLHSLSLSHSLPISHMHTHSFSLCLSLTHTYIISLSISIPLYQLWAKQYLHGDAGSATRPNVLPATSATSFFAPKPAM